MRSPQPTLSYPNTPTHYPMSNPKNPEPAVGQVYLVPDTGEVFAVKELYKNSQGQHIAFRGKTGRHGILMEGFDLTYLGTLDELRAWAEQRQNKPGGFRDEDGVWHSYEDADEKGGGE